MNFSTGNSDDEKVRDFVTDQAKFTFAHMKGYWSELLATNEMATAAYEANIATESVVSNSFVG